MRIRAISWVALVIVARVGIAAEAPEPYKPAKDITEGTQIELIYFGGSHCGPCKTPAMREAVLRAKTIIAKRAAAKKQAYSTTGVALDLSVEDGLEYLKEVGPFDQVISGRLWFNQGVLDWIAPYPDAIVGIPQIVVVERQMTLDKGRARWSQPKILVRIPGTGIPLWVDAGAETN